MDESPLGLGYYRLQIEDLDGSIEYSQVVVLERKDFEANWMLYPNPARSSLWIQSDVIQEAFELRLVDMLGQVWHQEKMEGSNGLLEIEIDQLPPGKYYVQIKGGQETKSIPFIKIL